MRLAFFLTQTVKTLVTAPFYGSKMVLFCFSIAENFYINGFAAMLPCRFLAIFMAVCILSVSFASLLTINQFRNTQYETKFFLTNAAYKCNLYT